jgi:ribonuclease T1
VSRLAALFAWTVALALAGVCGTAAARHHKAESTAADIATISVADLPPEGRQTLALIVRGGPFPYPHKDGSVFGNFERQLPPHERGYYREYTVPTPGARDRGARRIVAGGEPPSEYFYTADHYRSWSRIVQP